MLQQKCGEFRIDYPYLQKDNLLNSSRDLLVAFGSLRKKNEKGKKGRERHTTGERKNEKVIKRKGDREKRTRRKIHGKKREKEKER